MSHALAHALAYTMIEYTMGGAHRIRILFAYYSHAIQWYTQVGHVITYTMGFTMAHTIAHTMAYTNTHIKCAYYRVYNGVIRLIIKLLTIYRVTEAINSNYYLLIGPCPDPRLTNPTKPRVGI